MNCYFVVEKYFKISLSECILIELEKSTEESMPNSLKFLSRVDARQLKPLFQPIYWYQSKNPELTLPATESKGVQMTRFNQLGKLMVVMEALFILGADFALYKIQDWYDLLKAFRVAQNVVLKYNEQGWLLDHGKPEAAQKDHVFSYWELGAIRWSNQNWIRMICQPIAAWQPQSCPDRESRVQREIISGRIWWGSCEWTLLDWFWWDASSGWESSWDGMEWHTVWSLSLESVLSMLLLFN